MKVQGLKQLIKKLQRLEKKAAGRALRKALRAGTSIVAKEVKKQTPVDRGYLKQAQTSKVSVKRNRGAGVIGADAGKLEVKDPDGVGTRPSNIDWLVEFGHVNEDGTVVPPSGHHRRAEAAALPRAEQAIAQKLAEEIEKEAAK